ncbi:glycosyltransferase family 2 protein [Vibrio vulnificus]|nr:glycosyltransferase family 2 protein [Vibrio vulnificus]
MITIIIPVYNAEKTIKACIESIFLADKKKPNLIYEVIAIDDGSSDNTSEKLTELSIHYKKLTVITQKNTGAGGARNKGIRESKTKFISFVDSDDLVHEDYLSPLLDKKDKDIISFNMLKMSKSNKISIIKPKDSSGPMVCAFFNKSIFIKNDLFFPEGINYEDNAISFLVWSMNKENRVHIDKDLYIYNYLPSSQSNTGSPKHITSRIESMLYLQKKAKSLRLFDKYKNDLGEMAFNLAYIPAMSLCFRHFSNYKLYIKTKSELSKVYIRKPKNTPFKKSIFYFCIQHLGYFGYLLICIKRLNKIYR